MMIQKYIRRGRVVVGLLLFASLFLISQATFAAEPSNSATVTTETGGVVPLLPPDEYFRGVVRQILDDHTDTVGEYYTEHIQTVSVELTSGPDHGQLVTIENGGVISVEAYTPVTVGERLIIARSYKVDGTSTLYLYDRDRLPGLIGVAFAFILLVVGLGRRKGIGALIGLVVSIGILAGYIVPRILTGHDPLATTLVGALGVVVISLFLAHGFHRRTAIAALSTSVTLVIAVWLSELFTRLTQLSGQGSEDAWLLQSNNIGVLDLRGLFLAGIVIGTLGVLDDITTAQTAIVGELQEANPALSARELYRRALVVGREHIASLVNTLVLAYAGASLPLFLVFQINTTTPLWLKLNTEFIAEEFIRTMVGSVSLVLAVPIATASAVYFLTRYPGNPGSRSGHSRGHHYA